MMSCSWELTAHTLDSINDNINPNKTEGNSWDCLSFLRSGASSSQQRLIKVVLGFQSGSTMPYVCVCVCVCVGGGGRGF